MALVFRTNPVTQPRPGCSLDVFASVMRQHGSPWADRAAELYDIIVTGDGGLLLPSDPAFWLGVAIAEHHIGSNRSSVLWRNDTRSWGNARSIVHPQVSGHVITDAVRGSRYAAYDDVADSLRDCIYRIQDPNYVYQREGRFSIAAIVERWTESDGDEYLDTVLATMTSVYFRTYYPQIPIEVAFIPLGAPNRPGFLIPDLVGVTVHSTGNTNRGAGAEMHRAFTHAGGGEQNVSFTWCGDDERVILLLPLDEVGWHAGDGAHGIGNRRTHAYERCVNADGDPARSIDLMARVTAMLRMEAQLAEHWTYQHNHWSGKDCPHSLRRSGWDAYLALTMHYAIQMQPTDFTEQAADTYGVRIGEHYLGGGFYRYWLEFGGLVDFGLPISGEYLNWEGVTCQDFERARMEHRPGRGCAYDVQLGLVNAELRDALATINALQLRIDQQSADLLRYRSSVAAQT